MRATTAWNQLYQFTRRCWTKPEAGNLSMVSQPERLATRQMTRLCGDNMEPAEVEHHSSLRVLLRPAAMLICL
ncbi:MAG: hypothetical protein GY761_12280 [Hyphomicrobiales bacterium]|nr:hypothetical protein [Hyphomicrobiales bacterium]